MKNNIIDLTKVFMQKQRLNNINAGDKFFEKLKKINHKLLLRNLIFQNFKYIFFLLLDKEAEKNPFLSVKEQVLLRLEYLTALIEKNDLKEIKNEIEELKKYNKEI